MKGKPMMDDMDAMDKAGIKDDTSGMKEILSGKKPSNKKLKVVKVGKKAGKAKPKC